MSSPSLPPEDDRPDPVEYHYTENNLVGVVEVEGQSLELNDAQQQRFPGNGTLPQTLSTRTAIRSTVEDVKETYGSLETSDAIEDKSILVDIEATHGGYYNDNMYYYRYPGMEKMVSTWTEDGGRPYLVFHDEKSEPRGRVTGARAVQTADSNDFGEPMGFHALDVRVGNQKEIEMIIDGRALHVSVGSRPVDTVECRICSHDIYHDGKTERRYKLQEKPSDEVLEQPAPGVFGQLDMTYEDFFKIDETDGTWTATCRHIRHHEAPVGGDDTVKTGWIMHGQKYKEVSRVNEPADVNEETGEYAHIRGRKDQSNMEDSAIDKVVADELAQTPGPNDHARYSLASEDDLWRPRTAEEAARFAEESGFSAMFDTALWTTINATNQKLNMADRAERYWKQGGRFLIPKIVDHTTATDNSQSQNRIKTTDADMTDAHADAKYSQGDKVKWSWQGGTVHGRVAESGESFTVEGNEITGEDGEPVYKLDEWDDEAEEFKDGNVAKPESSLSKSDKDMQPSDSSGDDLSLHEALKLEDAREFGEWLRDSQYDGEDADMIDRMYTRRLMKRTEDAKDDWESAGSTDLDTTGSLDGEWDGSDALDQMMNAAEGEDGEIDESMVKRGVAAFDSSSDGQNKSDYKGQFAVVQDGELVADMAGIDSLNKMAEQMDVPQSVIDDAKSLVESYMPEEEQEEE